MEVAAPTNEPATTQSEASVSKRGPATAAVALGTLAMGFVLFA